MSISVLTEARQDQRVLAMHEVAAIQLGGDVDCKVELAQCRLHADPSGTAAAKFPPSATKTFASPRIIESIVAITSLRALPAPGS